MREPITWHGIPMVRHRWSVTGLVNIVLLQWFFLRLNVATSTEDSGRVVGIGILFPVLPLSGWSSSFRPERPRQIWFWAVYHDTPIYGVFTFRRPPPPEEEPEDFVLGTDEVGPDDLERQP